MQQGIAATEIITVFEKILDGIAAAHTRRVWHRDLKPENILVSKDLTDVRIADFGIAHFEQDELYSEANTKAGDRLANFRYAAPEQRDPNAEKDHRADIFALGLMLHEMFTGEVPQGTSYRKIGDVEPEFGHLDAVVERMIRQRADDRPSSSTEVRQLIRNSGNPGG
jgi:serine/threonine protein kinase